MNDDYVVNEENLREELLNLSSKKEIKQTEKYLKQASAERLEKIKSDYELLKLDRVNTLLTETLISKFSLLLEELNMIKDEEKLETELSGNKLFCEDIKSIVTKIAPYIPMIGLLTGVLVVAKHVWDGPGDKGDVCPVAKNVTENVPNFDPSNPCDN